MTIDGGWEAGIGDPTVVGWVTVGAYLVCAVLCLFASLRRQYDVVRRRPVDRNPASVWIVLAILMVALGINKQLDLQILLSQVGRELANHQGWYDRRDQLQLVFVGGLALAGVTISALSLYWMRLANLAVKWALLGLFILLCFVLIRASSFHNIDSLLGFQVGETRMNLILELGSLAVIAGAAIAALVIPRKSEYQRGRF